MASPFAVGGMFHVEHQARRHPGYAGITLTLPSPIKGEG